MAFERLIGLHVVDEAQYTRYREKMTPILSSYGGEFGYDLRVAEVLKSPLTDSPSLNRVFTIRFPTEETSQAFFADTAYRDVRREHFENAVDQTTVMATYAPATD